MSQVKLSVLTFNIWDLFVARHRTWRMRAIVEELRSPNYDGAVRYHDIVAFQEMWSTDTYRYFRSHLRDILPYSHYFDRGAMGSGLAIFSKYPIVQVHFKAFSLNGQPDRITDGDWFATKGVGHARIQHPKAVLDVFTTHLIADYSERPFRSDNYLAHRLTQTYELVEFVESHSSGSVTLVMGDFNFEKSRLEWKTFLENHQTLASVFGSEDQVDTWCTCNCPSNGYSKPDSVPKTIDYIMYSKDALKLDSVGRAFTANLRENPKAIWKGIDKDGIPQSYSDHFAVTSLFTIVNSPARTKLADKETPDKVICDKTLQILRTEVKTVSEHRQRYILSSVVSFVLLLILCLVLGTMLAKTPNTTYPFYWMLVILPLLSASVFFYTCLYTLHSPRETALLSQFVSEIQYYIQNL
ncbi:Sphingomyelin phosphodiesterase 2 [Paramicrosporidium saccamoebae]|uniref:Sphingomyelin phosphodiesterase 2 n=1 Tax=Paramicrosporidium saccamoebae TaxID=1246581 RepID=A0A2H9TGV4_9FUNG|nr:Sphingomyelin phosphodiesterase 2 [Paramicrosporidium saccamoebae]